MAMPDRMIPKCKDEYCVNYSAGFDGCALEIDPNHCVLKQDERGRCPSPYTGTGMRPNLYTEGRKPLRVKLPGVRELKRNQKSKLKHKLKYRNL